MVVGTEEIGDKWADSYTAVQDSCMMKVGNSPGCNYLDSQTAAEDSQMLAAGNLPCQSFHTMSVGISRGYSHMVVVGVSPGYLEELEGN